MDSQALQGFVKNIFGDETARQDFQRDPNGVLARYDLTEPEKRAVLQTHARFGLVGAGSGQMAATLESKEGWGAPIPFEASLKGKEGWGAPIPFEAKLKANEGWGAPIP